MSRASSAIPPRAERAPLDLDPETFRAAGHRLVDELAEFFATIGERPVTPGEPVARIRELLGTGPLPAEGRPAGELLAEILPLVRDHSLHNGHPRFFGYITSSAAPLGALAELLAAAMNPNLGLWDLSPVASEIETQTVGWLAELVGYPQPCGGLMVSGGNMANIVGFLAARAARAGFDVRAEGLTGTRPRLTVHASRETHTWIEKAADVSGLGTDAIRWIPTDAVQRMRVDALEERLERDRAAGHSPFLVVGTAGNVGTGAIDPLAEIAEAAARHGLWFHVDGAYGAPAAVLDTPPPGLEALGRADSLALDPHKWLYAPIEAACTLVRDPDALKRAFSYHPSYYATDDDAARAGLDYYEHGLQNTRGFRALKVWLALRQAGRAGYARMIGDDIALAERLFAAAEAHPELEARTRHLSIATFRYRPLGVAGDAEGEAYLDTLNERLVRALQRGGEAYVSQSRVDGRLYLRACIVNFRTRAADVEALPEIVARRGRALDREMRGTR